MNFENMKIINEQKNKDILDRFGLLDGARSPEVEISDFGLFKNCFFSTRFTMIFKVPTISLLRI